MNGNGVRIVADGGFDQVRRVVQSHVATRGIEGNGVLAALDRFERGSESDEKWSLPSAFTCFLTSCRNLGLPVEIVLRVPSSTEVPSGSRPH